MPTDYASVAIAGFGTVAAIASARAAVILTTSQRVWEAADAYMRISERFESDTFRSYRRKIYALDRSSYTTWADDERQAVEDWCAHLDLVSILVLGSQLNLDALFKMYGDVIIRTIYQIAPYCRHQESLRGEQFLLPLRMLTELLLKHWSREARKGRYPLVVGFPTQPDIKLSVLLFERDDAIVQFRVRQHSTNASKQGLLGRVGAVVKLHR